MYTILSIRRFLLLNLLATIIITVIITTLANYYIDLEAMNYSLDNLLIKTGTLLKTITSNRHFLAPTTLQAIQAQIDTYSPPKKNLPGTVYPDKNAVHYKFQLWSKNGTLLLTSPTAPKASLIGKPGLSDKTVNGSRWRTFTTYNNKHSVIFAFAEQYASRHIIIHRMLMDDIYLTLLIYPLSGLIIWFIIGSGLKSIRFFAKEVAERAADYLEPVDLNKVPLEISPLVDELNKLFLRLQQAFEREQRFSADAAHELHTPLAALKTQAQVALKSTDPKEYHDHLKQVIISVDRCAHVIQQLLTLCRLSPETILPEHFTKVDLAQIAAEVIAQLAPQAVLKQIEIELLATDSEHKLLANAMGLHILIRNLVDNAIRYTPRGGSIRVIILNQAHTVLLQVIDNGPGIPLLLRARVFERFFRVIGSNTQGSGLGLAIVAQITKLHYGSTVLSEPDKGSGLKVEVRLPKSKT